MADQINKIGLGVELEGGRSVIDELREIRQEYIAIAQASRSIQSVGGNAGGAGGGRRGGAAQRAREEKDELTLIQREMIGQMNLFGHQQLDLLENLGRQRTETTKRSNERTLAENTKFYAKEKQQREEAERSRAKAETDAVNNRINADKSFYQRRSEAAKAAQEEQARRDEQSARDRAAHQRRIADEAAARYPIANPPATSMRASQGTGSLAARVQARMNQIVDREYTDKQGNINIPGPDDQMIDALARRQLADQQRFTGQIGDRRVLNERALQMEAQDIRDKQFRRRQVDDLISAEPDFIEREAEAKYQKQTLNQRINQRAQEKKAEEEERIRAFYAEKRAARDKLFNMSAALEKGASRFAFERDEKLADIELQNENQRRVAQERRDRELKENRRQHAENRRKQVQNAAVLGEFASDDELALRLNRQRRYAAGGGPQAPVQASRDQLALEIRARRQAYFNEKAERERLEQERQQAEDEFQRKLDRVARARTAKKVQSAQEEANGDKEYQRILNLERDKLHKEELRQRARTELGAPAGGGRGGRGGGPGGPNGPNLEPRGLLNERGFFGTTDMIGRISRNILLYQLVAGATYGLENYIATSLTAAKVASQTATDLESAAKKAQQSYDGLVKFAEGVRLGSGVSREAGQRAVAEAAYFTEPDPSLTKPLTTAIARIAASRGLGGDKVPELIENLRRLEPKQYKRVIGKTTEELYEEEARRIVQRNGDRYVPGEGDTPAERRRNNLTEEQRISRQVALFTQDEKYIIAARALIEESTKLDGAIERHQKTVAGQIERTNARWEDAKVAVGNFILTLKPLVGLLDAVNARFEKWTALQVRATGTNGEITAADVERSGRERVGSFASRAGQFVSDYGMDLAVLGGTLAVGGFAGRGRARTARRREEYTRVRDENLALGYSPSEAQALALDAAKDLKAGYRNSIKTGFTRINGAMNKALYSMFEFIAGEVAAQKTASLAGRIAGIGGPRIIMGSAIPGIASGATTVGAAAIGGGISAGAVGLGVAGVGVVATALGALFTVVDSYVRNGTLDKAGEDLTGFFGSIRDGLDELFNSTSINKLREIVAGQAAFEEKARQQAEDRASGRARFQEYTGGGTTGTSYTIEQFNRLRAANPNLFQVGNPDKPEVGKYIQTRASDEDYAKQVGAVNEKNRQAEEYRNRREIEDQRRRDKEDKDRQQRVNEQSQALAKLRETAAGSFRVVQETADAFADENPYVKVLADSETAAVRMRQQWQFLGDEAVKYNTTLEMTKINMQLMKLEMDSFVKAQDILNKGALDRINVQRPGPNRRQSDAQSVLQSAITAATEIPRIWAKELAVLGRPQDAFERERALKDQLTGIQGLTGLYGAGGDRRAMGEAINNALVQMLEGSGLSANQIGNDTFLKDVALRAYGGQRGEILNKIRDEVLKSRLNRQEDDLLTTNIAQAERARDAIRQNAISRGLDPERATRETGRVFDRYLISRTDNVDPKDLTFDQFQARQEALKREAVRTVEEQKEAKDAVKKGLQYQEQLLNEVRVLRAAILGGDTSVLIQVLNETQARVDQEALQEADGAGFDVPLRAAADNRINPYAGDFARYGRGGRK